MACSISNPAAPDGTPSVLFAELQTQYSAEVAEKIYLHSEFVREHKAALLSPQDVRASGELTMEAARRLTPYELVGIHNQVNQQALASAGQTLTDTAARLKNELGRRLAENERRGFAASLPGMTGLRALINSLYKASTAGAYVQLFSFVDERTTTLLQLLDRNTSLMDPANDDHVALMASFQKELELLGAPLGVAGLVKENSDLSSVVDVLNGRLARVKAQMTQWMQDALQEQIQRNSTNPELQDADKRAAVLQQGEDISLPSLMMQSIDASADPIVAGVGKVYERAKISAQRAGLQFRQRLSGVVDALKKAGGGVADYAYMEELDAQTGERTGRYVRRESGAYHAEKERLYNLIVDPASGRPLDYITGIPEHLLSAADKAHNIRVAELRKERSEFFRAEQFGNGLSVIDGEHHRYTTEFKGARAQYQDVVMGPHGPTWVKKARPPQGLTTTEFELGYEEFLREYFQPEDVFSIPVTALNPRTSQYEYTGEIIQEPRRFPKLRYVEATERWESAGYQRIQQNTGTALGRAQREFYNFFRQAHEQQALRRLPPSVRRKMEGSIPRIRKERAGSFSESLVNGAKAVGRLLNPGIDANIYTKQRLVDEDGRITEDVPIYYVGSLKNQQEISRLETELAAAREKRKQEPRDKDLEQQESRLRQQLKEANSRMQADELETDFGKSLLLFYDMAEEYHALKLAEPQMQQALALVAGRQYLNTDASGTPILDQEGNPSYGKQGRDSNLFQQLQSFLALNVYNSVQTDSVMERVTDSMMRWSGTLLQYFNLGSHINELVSGNINQLLETRHGYNGLLKEGTLRAAQQEVIGSTMSKGGEELMMFFQQPDVTSRPHNKVQAVMESLFIKQDTSNANSLRTGTLMDAGYLPINIFEYYTTSTLAVARLRSVEVKHYQTGEVKPLYDVLHFNEQTGELVADPDYVSEQELVGHVAQIRSMTRSIHGNFAQHHRVHVQRFMLGRLAYQFKKWFYNLGRSRFGERYYDEGMQTHREGRYRTVGAMLKNIYLMDFNVRQNWQQMSPEEKHNVYRTAYDLATFAGLVATHVLIGAAAGDDDDKDALSHRLVQFVSRQAQRSAGEVSFGFNPVEWVNMLKNPLPVLRSLDSSAKFLSDFAGVGGYLLTDDEKHIIIQRGLRKGEYKLTNDALKLLPGGVLKGQWEQLAQSDDYFVR